jgi:pilus assembly protein CpaE
MDDEMTESAVRPTILVALTPADQEPVVMELLEAGFIVLEARTPEDLAAATTSSEPFGLAVVDTTLAPQQAVASIQALRQQRGQFPTLFLTSPESFDAVDEAGISADDELAMRPIAADSVRWRVEAMVVRSSIDPTTGAADSELAGETLHQLNNRSPILAVFNPKGGVGKTTLATNLAAMLQVRKGRSVLLVDADTVTGHVALSLGMKGLRGVADTWGAEMAGDFHEPLLNLAAKHSSGIRVATMTTDPLAMPHLDPGRVTETLLEARDAVDAVIVDLHPSYSDVNLAIFATATRILVPVTPDLPAVRAAVQLTRVAGELGVRDRLSLVVNRAGSGISVADIEKTTGLKSIAGVRSAGILLVRAGNFGRTLVEQCPNERVTEDFDRLADRILELVGAATPAHAADRSGARARRRYAGGLLRPKAAPKVAPTSVPAAT